MLVEGEGARQPTAPAELTSRVRDLLATRRSTKGPLLVVVDDVREEWWDAAVLLLKTALPQNVPAVFTTQDLVLAAKFTTNVVPLDVLSRDEAAGLLEVYVGRALVNQNRSAADSLLERVGFLPLGVELVGRQVAALAQKPGFTIAEHLAALEHDAASLLNLRLPGHPGLAATFYHAYQSVSPEAQALFRKLGLFSFTVFSAAQISAELEMEGAESDGVLDELVQKSLLSWESLPSFYRQHPLLHEYSKKLLTPGERTNALYSRRSALAAWLEAVQGSYRGIFFLANLLYDIENERIAPPVLRRLLTALEAAWTPAAASENPLLLVSRIVHSDPGQYLLAGPPVPGLAPCSRLMLATEFIEFHLDSRVPMATGSPAWVAEALEILEHAPRLDHVLKGEIRSMVPMAFVTRTDALDALMPENAETRASAVRMALGAMHWPEGEVVVEVVYPEEVSYSLDLRVPTCLDLASSIDRSTPGADGWAHVIRVDTLSEGLPMAVHPPIPLTGSFRIRNLGTLGPSMARVSYEEVRARFYNDWTDESMSVLKKAIASIRDR